MDKTILVAIYVVLAIGCCGASLKSHRSSQRLMYHVENIEIQQENVNKTMNEPPPHEMAAKMARYIVHSSGKLIQYDTNPIRFLSISY